MSGAEEDLDLRERFDELRKRDSIGVPAFEHTLSRARRRMHIRWWPAWAAAAAGLTAVAVWLSMPAPSTSQPIHFVSAQWHSPTDFLLESPNDELLRLAWVPGSTSDLGRLQLPRTPEEQ